MCINEQMASGLEWQQWHSSGESGQPRPSATPVSSTGSTPEPPPRNEGVPVTPELVSFLFEHARFSTLDPCPVVDLIRDRDAFGRAKYHQPLMTGDGRDSCEDAVQEFGDLLQYVFKARMNGESVERLAEMRWALDAVLGAESREN